MPAPFTKAQLTTEIGTNWPDNNSGAITPALLRSTVLDLLNSYGGLADINTFTAANTFSGGASITTSFSATNLVTNASLAQMNANTIKGNNTGGLANAADLTVPQVQAITNQGYIVISVTGVNANSANTDTAVTVTLPTGFTKYRIANIFSYNPSISLTTATAGVFTATGGGGVAVVSNVALAALTTNTADTAGSFLNHSVTLSVTAYFNDTTLYYRIGSAQGAPATVDFAIYIQAVK